MTIDEILQEEFMKPLNLSVYAVAKLINVPTSRIQDPLHDRRKVIVDTSVRLGRFLKFLIVIFLIFKMVLISAKLRQLMTTARLSNISQLKV